MRISLIGKMQDMIRDTIQSYYTDLLHDGMIMEKHGMTKTYLWMVRDTGTHLICLTDMKQAERNEKYFRQLVNSNERFLFFSGYGTEQEQHMELTPEKAYNLLMNQTR